jgi:hypothetical protein
MRKSQGLFNLTTALHVSGVTITHLQEHKTTATTASGNRYTVIDKVKFADKFTSWNYILEQFILFVLLS